ncbi:MAG: phospholipid carrier-dependent glycosyltransferase [Caldilineaceae bacterium]
MSALHRSTPIRLLLLGLLLAGFALRVFRLDAQSLWYDEGVTAWVAQMTPADAIAWTADDIQPPLYYLTVAFWGRLASWSEWSLRFLAAWWGLLVLPLLGAVTLRLTRRPAAAVVTVLLAAVHPLLIYYSQEVCTPCSLRWPCWPVT